MEKRREPITVQELVDNLFATHDAEIHALFSRLMGIDVDLSNE